MNANRTGSSTTPRGIGRFTTGLCVSIALGACQAGSIAEARQLLVSQPQAAHDAWQAFQRGAPETALQRLQQLCPSARLIRADALQEQAVLVCLTRVRLLAETRQWNTARDLAIQMLEADPGAVAVHQHLSWIYLNLHAYTLSIWHGQQALKQKADDTASLLNVGRSLEALGRLTLAEASFERAVAAQSSNHQAWFYLARLQIRTGAYAQALESIQKARALQPRNPEYICLAGETGVVLQLYRPGRASLQQCLELQPKRWSALYMQGIAAIANRQWSLAEASIQTLQDNQQELPARQLQAWLLLRQQRYLELRNTVVRWQTDQVPLSNELQYLLALAQSHNGEYDQALVILQSLEPGADHLPEYWWNRGQVAWQLQRLPEARSAWQLGCTGGDPASCRALQEFHRPERKPGHANE
ncbi:MAG: tetratricopeptide repeat protein [Leptospiraceae bacterium]|nr:tetratricopeptide repeat protein [Leptospiraceae bacterium]